MKQKKIDKRNYNLDAEKDGKIIKKSIPLAVFRNQNHLKKALEKEFPKDDCLLTEEEQEAIRKLTGKKKEEREQLIQDVKEV